MKQIFVWFALALTATANYAAQQVPWDTANACGMTMGVPQGVFLRGVGAQVQITKEFGQAAPKAAAEYAGAKAAELRAQGNEAEAKKWDEGGEYRVAIHTLIGAIGGGNWQSALGAGVTATAAPYIDELQTHVRESLVAAGVPASAALMLSQLTGQATALGIATVAGGGNVNAAAMGYNIDSNNRQLHPNEARLIKDNAQKYADKHPGMTLDQAEAELTRQALKQVDSAFSAYDNNSDAAAFLNGLVGSNRGTAEAMYHGAGQSLFNEGNNSAMYNNHVVNAQFLSDPNMRALYNSIASPSNRSLMSNSAIAISQAATDAANINSLPPAERKQMEQNLRIAIEQEISRFPNDSQMAHLLGVGMSQEDAQRYTASRDAMMTAHTRLLNTMFVNGDISAEEKFDMIARAMGMMGAGMGGSLLGSRPRTETVIRPSAGERGPNRISDEQTANSNFQQQRTFWSEEPVNFNGNRVYQRNDLIDANRIDPKTGMTNLELMQQGRAPIGPDGNPINLHHMTQTQSGPIAELTQSFHQQNSGVIHVNSGSGIPSGINRVEFDSWRAQYWRNRANGF